jgi:hypothetical protein
MKICSKCKLEKPIQEFHETKRRGRIETHFHCKKCHAELHRVNYIDKLSDKYIERALREQGHINISKDLIELKRNLIILKRTICKISKM